MKKGVRGKATKEELKILRSYARGDISTGTAAKKLGISISELFDLMKELGIRYNAITMEAYMEGLKNLRKVW
ncbi:MAG: hypothetical protein HY517_04375 [Candidatus Aenigmarchaeota archaeon]|nr:hypothetical protein [Candidatus Aenigmarchaeota archaeon]